MHYRRSVAAISVSGYYNYLSVIIVLLSMVVCLWSRNIHCESSLSSSTLPLSSTGLSSSDSRIGTNVENLIKKGLQQLTAGHHHEEKASLRGLTSSQVIEYSPRNIAIMTLLNSMLILGGLLGSMSRNDAGRPFSKRVDFSRLKRGFLPKRFTSPKLPLVPINSPVQPVQPVQNPNQVMMFPNEHSYFHNPTLIPAKPHSFESQLNEFRLNPNEMFTNVHPRVPYEVAIERRRAIDSTPDTTLQMTASKCRHILQCFDQHGKQIYNPSLSPLANSAFKLLDGAIGTNEHSTLMQNVKELVQIEQNNTCVINYVCQPSIGHWSTSPTPSKRVHKRAIAQ